jgi:dienelactone hydrolase
MNSRRDFLTLSAGATLGLAVQNPVASVNLPSDTPQMKPSELRQKLKECLGGDWPEPCPLKPKVLKTEQTDGFTRHLISYEVEPGDRIQAYLLIPDGISAQNPAPAIAIWHQHNGEYHLGKSEPAGLSGNPMHHTGAALAKEGYVTLCPDALCFEDRQDPTGKTKGHWYERYEFLRYIVAGKCMAWKNILDMRRAIDLLVSRPEVNAGQIGCYGHSMGSTHTWLVGPWEPRLKALVGNCCLPTYHAIHDEHILHCFPNFVPGWHQYGDTPEIASLTAPRALHLNLGELDQGSPIDEAKAGVERIRTTYKLQGAESQFSAFIEESQGHVLSEAMWEKVKAFFGKHLTT